jgi:hypothetical protein
MATIMKWFSLVVLMGWFVVLVMGSCALGEVVCPAPDAPIKVDTCAAPACYPDIKPSKVNHE